MGLCSKWYHREKDGRKWKTAGDDVQYEIVSEQNCITVYFQCTTTKIDWQHNFQFLPKRVWFSPEAHIWVFRGMWNAFISAWPVIFQELIEQIKKEPDSVVAFAGHSYGGAMTVLASLMYSRQIRRYKEKPPLPIAYTHGAPKVLFGRKTVKLFNEAVNARNWACHNDLVARMPPFYPRYKTTKFVGDRFNLIKMLSKVEYYHTCYDELEDD